jgi:aminopeptidase
VQDPRFTTLAKLLVTHSCALEPDERVLIEAFDIPFAMLAALIRETAKTGARPFVNLKNDRVNRELLLAHDEESLRLFAELELNTMEKMDAFIGIRAFSNISELADVPAAKKASLMRLYIEPVHLRQRNRHTKWVACRWPTAATAQKAGMSTPEFEELFFRSSCIDHGLLEERMQPLAELMGTTRQVRVVGPGRTDLTFSIEEMACSLSAGRHNVPDGELFTAPIRESVNGAIEFNVPAVLLGTTFQNIRLEFDRGKVVEASAGDSERLQEVLDQDEGARYVGEFAFGLNPHLDRPVGDVLFDEKMWGSVHIALGNAYAECDNGNRSALHWDLVLKQTPGSGGGEIYFDDRLVRKDGRFVVESLCGLNPEQLIGVIQLMEQDPSSNR